MAGILDTPLRQRIKNDTFCVYFKNDAMLDAWGGSNDTFNVRAGRRNPNVPASHHPAIRRKVDYVGQPLRRSTPD
jgi:hypothetical protein